MFYLKILIKQLKIFHCVMIQHMVNYLNVQYFELNTNVKYHHNIVIHVYNKIFQKIQKLLFFNIFNVLLPNFISLL